MIGRRVSHFEIRERLGKGGMASVYKAWDVNLKRHVALKILHEDLAQSESRDWILHEAQAASKIEHVNIATVYEVFEFEGRTYLAMQLLEGGTLAERIEKEPLPIEECVRIALAVAKGLDEAHGKGLLHRDVKPQNIMFTAQGAVKLTDFGLAKGADVDSTKTRTGVVRGTAQYLPPEVLKAAPWSIQGDVYSVGVVLYEMLTGRRPFHGEGHHQLFQAILNAEPGSISELRPDVPRRMEEVVVRALEKRPEDRYASAAELCADLESVLADLETGAELTRGGKVRSRRLKRKRLWTSAALVAATVVILGFFGMRFLTPESHATTAIAVIPLQTGLGEGSTDLQVRLLARMLTTDLSQSSRVRVLGYAGLQQILVNQGLETVSDLTVQALRNVSRSARLTHVITVSLAPGSDSLRADIEILEVSEGLSLGSASEEAVGSENIVGMVDPLVAKARRVLLSSEELAADEDRRFGDLTSNSSEAVKFYYEAQELANQGLVPQAIAKYDEALAIDSDFYLARQWREVLLKGNAAALDDVNIDALSEYERLVHKSFEGWATGDIATMEESADEILSMRRADWIGLNTKYGAQFFSGRFEEAIRTCESGLRVGYRQYIDHLFLNSAYFMSGRSIDEIILRYRELLQEDPTDVMLTHWLAFVYVANNQDAEAEKLIAEVLGRMPDNETFYKTLADAYTWRTSNNKEADYERALEYLYEVARIRASGDGPVGQTGEGADATVDWLLWGVPWSYRVGEIAFLRGQTQKAIDAYQQSVATNPAHYNVYYRLGLAYQNQNMPDMAIANFSKYLGIEELGAYDATAQGRDDACAANPWCHAISRPRAVVDAQQRVADLQK